MPESRDELIGEDDLVRVIDLLADELNLGELGFAGNARAQTGRPGYHPGCC
jgi:hypothetical protein